MKRCAVGGCAKPYYAKGLCGMHYSRQRRHGDPTVVLKRVALEKPAICTIRGCDGPYYCRGYCQNHVRRLRLYGDPLGGGPDKPKGRTPEERFWSHVNKTDDSWEWDAVPKSGKRPRFTHTVDGVEISTSCADYSWKLHGGPPLGALVVSLACENKQCVRYDDHMVAVTVSEFNRLVKAKITQCPSGHLYNEANTRLDTNGHRYCQVCSWARVHRRRSKILDGDLIFISDIFERDQGVCQLCHEPVDPTIRWPHGKAQSIDHIVPLNPADPNTAPGAHTFDNVQLAHCFCNWSKNNRS